MGRQVNKLSARKVETVKEPGRHSDGGGLYLNVTETGARSAMSSMRKVSVKPFTACFEVA